MAADSLRMGFSPRLRRDRPIGRSIPILAAVLLWVAASAVGCGPCQRSAPESLTLIEALPAAEWREEHPVLKPSDPSALPDLREGWSMPAPQRWSTGARSGIDFFLLQPRAGQLRLSGRPAPGPPQSVEVRVNGVSVGGFKMRHDLATYRVPVPSEVLRAGDNRLTLEYAWHADPTAAGLMDRRPFAALWREVAFELPPEPRASAVTPLGIEEHEDGPWLVIPSQGRLDYCVRAGDYDRLILDGLESRSGPPASLEVSVSAESGETLARWDAAPGEPRRELALPPGRDAWWRISLEARPVDSDAPGALLALRGARLVRTAPAPLSKQRSATASAAAGRHPNLVIYLIDTLRPDHLDPYRPSRQMTPRISQFASEGIVFEDAVAQSSFTRSALGSIFTGMLPVEHGAYGVRGRLTGSTETLAERLRADGYQTAGFITNGNASNRFGFGRGFDVYELLREDIARPSFHQLSDALNERVFRWLDSERDGRPFFLYVHATDPHVPYTPPPDEKQRWAPEADPALGSSEATLDLFLSSRPLAPPLRSQLVSLYDAEIAFNDRQFGALMDSLQQRGLLDDSVVTLLSDHGEEFYEHSGWGHGTTLFAEQVQIPLVIRLPGARRAGERISATATQTDLLPTLLGALGEPAPQRPGSRDLLAETPSDSGRAAYSFLLHEGGSIGAESVVSGSSRLVRIYDGVNAGTEFLGDRRLDPGDRHDLAPERPVAVRCLSHELSLARARAPAEGGATVDLDSETEAALRAMGYLR